jgi:hypothetical protein
MKHRIHNIIFLHPIALVNDIIFTGSLEGATFLVLIDCWCAVVSLFINVTFTICFDFIRSSSNRYFHVTVNTVLPFLVCCSSTWLKLVPIDGFFFQVS